MRHRYPAIGVLVPVGVFVAFAFALVGSSAVASSGAGHASSSPAGHEGRADRNEARGVVGGAVERFHGAGACDLVDLLGLTGNWTHGSYVSAVAALGDPLVVPIAAHNSCGKPMVSVGHRNGPPAHALDHTAAGLEKAEAAKEQAEENVGEIPPVGS